VALPLLFLPVVLAGQQHEVTVDAETFRKAADGRRLADLARGARVELLRSEGSWAEVRLEGWLPAASLSATSREGHDRIVTRAGGVDLAGSPSGTATARLLQGFLLDHVSDDGEWTRVRRDGWVRLASLQPVAAVDRSFARPESVADADRPPPLVSEGRRLMTGEDPIEVHDAPDGDTVAVVRPGTPLTVVERGNRWTRVRVDGWVRSDRLVTQGADSSLVEASAGAMRASPDQYQGMRVRWTVQFVALELAEPERTDFYEGEPFLLARAPDPGDGFVYLAVPPELLEAAEALRPLQMIDVLAQVRAGRSALMGVPILDLLALF
jgi:hypothetical protein